MPRRLSAFLAAFVACAPLFATPPDPSAFQFKKFAHEPMLRDTVAVTVDEKGRVYATSVVRRQAADLDIRRFREWVETDLSLSSVDEKRDFLRRELTPENSAKYAGRFEDTNGDGFFDFNDLNLLADKISVMEDTDGDGVADTCHKFNATENTHITGIAAGLTAWDNTLYVAAEPDLVRLDDTNGDGIPDQRKVLAHGFSHHIGYGGHNFSGAMMGPDGRIYASAPDRGVNVVDANGVRHANPHSGAIVRVEPDGTGFEILATGLRNTHQPQFDAWGNLFAVDNDGDMPGEKERFVYIPDGSDAGWRTYWQYRAGAYNPWQAERLDVPAHAGQPAYLFPPLNNYNDGPAGFAFNPGTALSPAYRDYFFLSTFPSRQLFAFQAEPQGAGFKMANEHRAGSGILMVGLAFGPDGKLYLADWDSDGYAMDEKGAVWTMDDPASAGSPQRTETARLLKLDWKRQDVSFLQRELANADRRVRMKAQFELVRRGEDKALLTVARDQKADRFARGNAIWGLGQRLRQAKSLPAADLVALLADADAELRAQTAKVLGESRAVIPEATAALVPLLSDAADRPRFFAAIALGRLKYPAAVPALLEYARRDGADPYHRHAIVMGLAGCATSDQLAALTASSDRAERMAAVVALRRQHSPLVARFLSDADPLVVSEAATAIYDDMSIPEALPALADLTAKNTGANERTLRRALGAALRLRDAEHAAAVAAFAADTTQAVPLRVHALQLLKLWPAPPKLDSVQGIYRVLPPADAAAVAAKVAPVLRVVAKDSDPALARAAWESAAALGLQPDVGDLTTIVQQGTPLAADALRALEAAKADGLGALARDALKSPHGEVRAAALRALHHADSAAALQAAPELALGADIPLARVALEILAAADTPVLVPAVEALRAGKLSPALALDVVEAAGASKNAETKAALAAYQAAKDPANPLGPWIETLHGGDADVGRGLFETSVTAQCMLCHRVDGPGSNVGPRLNNIGRKSPDYLLRALVLPGADLAPGFGFLTLTLRNGESVTGAIVKEAAGQIRIKLPDASERNIAVADVTERTPPASLMPPLGQVMPARELRDILAYLRTLTGAPPRAEH